MIKVGKNTRVDGMNDEGGRWSMVLNSFKGGHGGTSSVSGMEGGENNTEVRPECSGGGFVRNNNNNSEGNALGSRQNKVKEDHRQIYPSSAKIL
jgi:hypothetical protein